MRITVTVVVIMFELTGALTYILPTMVCFSFVEWESEI
jgi:H+/Cl- antiporter ClcA